MTHKQRFLCRILNLAYRCRWLTWRWEAWFKEKTLAAFRSRA